MKDAISRARLALRDTGLDHVVILRTMFRTDAGYLLDCVPRYELIPERSLPYADLAGCEIVWRAE